MRTLAFIALAALGSGAYAQSVIQAQTLPATAVNTPLQVQRLAPQLVAFAGGQANFDSLVNGLASGNPITLATTLPTGATQNITFTPSGTMTTVQIAQTLESVRQSLITRGIGAPTPQQIATALTGGTLVTPAGSTPVNGVISTTTAATSVQQQSPAVAIQNTFGQAAAGASTSIRSQTSDSRFPRGISDSPASAIAPVTPAPIAQPAPVVQPPATAPLRTR
jgi:hypothetical protein